MKFVDFFAGLGGFHLAASRLPAECVFACEIDERLRRLYEKNFGILPAGDIRQIEARDVPRHDLLCAGFPCQPFSKAGEQLGWDDKKRGTVFFRVIEVLRVRRPKYVILENVAHFVRHDEGKTYQKVQRALSKLGYVVDSKQLSPHQFGVPQIRERMYLVGRQGDLNGFTWPVPSSHDSDLSILDVLDDNPADARKLGQDVMRCLGVWQEFLNGFPKKKKLPSFPIWSMEFKATYPYTTRRSLHGVPLERLRNFRGAFGCSLNAESRREILDRVPSHARGCGDVFPRWKQLFIRDNRRLYRDNKKWLDQWIPKIRGFSPSFQKLEWNCQGEERDIWKYILQLRASGIRVKRPTTSPSLVAMTSTQVPIIAAERRFMTARECARLQCLDELTHLPETGSAAVAALGNAVNVKVVESILRALVSKN